MAATPTVNSITRLDATPTNAATVRFSVVFNAAVTGVDVGDFSAVGSGGVAGASVAGVTGGPTTYTVTINTGAGSGTVALHLIDDDTIQDGSLVPLGGVGAGNGNFTTGQTYTIDKTPPVVTVTPSVSQATLTGSLPIVFTVTVTGATTTTVAYADIQMSGTATGVSYSLIGSLLIVNSVATDGTLVARVRAGAVSDSVGNQNAQSSNADNTVTYDITAPAVSSVIRAGSTPTNAAQVTFAVAFTESVTGVDAADFSVAQGAGLSGASVAGVSGSGANYTVTVNTGTGSGTLRLDVLNNGTIRDLLSRAMSGGTFSSGESYTIDRVLPTVTLVALLDSSPTNAATVRYAVQFSAAVTGVDATDFAITATGGSVSGASVTGVSGGGASYTVSCATGSGDGAFRLDVLDDDTITTAAGNALDGGYTSALSYTMDKTPPSCTLEQAVGQTDPAAALPVSFTVVFSENVTSFDASDVTIGGTATGATASVSGSGKNYTVSITSLTTDGTVIPAIAPGALTDAAGNPNTASVSSDAQVLIDTTPPTVSVEQAAGQSDPCNSLPIRFAVQFSEVVIGFDASDVQVQSGTGLAYTVTGAGATYEIEVSAANDGVVSVSVPAGAATDAAGHSNLVSTSVDNAVTLNTTPPAIALSAPSPAVTRSGPVSFTVTYASAAAITLTNTDVVVDATGTAAAGSITVTGTGLLSRTVTLAGLNGNGTLAVRINAGTASSIGGVLSPAAGPSASVTVDTTPPGLTLSSIAPDPTNGASIVVQASFDEEVSGFDAGDLSITNASLAAFAPVSASLYLITLSPSADGAVTLSVAPGAATDAAGNASAGASLTRQYDATSPIPTVTVISPSGGGLTGSLPIVFDVEFGETVTGFDASDLVFTGTAAGLHASVSGSGASYTVTVDQVLSEGTLALTVPAATCADAAGNPNQSGSSASVNYDATAPTVSVARAAAQPNPTAFFPIVFTIAFSEPVAGLDVSDFSFGSLAPITCALSGSGAAYTLEVNASADGTLEPSLPAGAASDTAGNPSDVSVLVGGGVVVNTQPPSITISPPSQSLTRNGPVTYTVTYGGAAGVSLDAADVTLVRNGSVTGTVSVSGAGLTERTITVDNILGDGTLSIALAANTAVSSGGQPAPAVISTTPFAVDNTPPTLTVRRAASQANPTSQLPVQFEILSDEPVIDVDLSDVILTGTASGLAYSLSGGGALYTVSVTSVAVSGTITASVTQGAAQDLAGNPSVNAASPLNSVTYSTMPGTVSISAPSAAVTRTGPVSYEISYTAAGSISLSPADITLQTTGTANATVEVSGSGLDVRTVTLDNITGDGELRIALAADTARTAANVPSLPAGPSAAVRVDQTPPAVEIVQAVGQNDPASAPPVRFSIHFSEPVTGFSTSDVTLGGTAAGTQFSVTGAGADYVLTVTVWTVDGTIEPSIAAGIAVDEAGNPNLASTGVDASVTVNTLPPTMSVSPPNPVRTRSGPVVYTLTYGYAAAITLSPADIAVVSTGTAAAGQVQVTGAGLIERQVTLSDITGEGTLSIGIAAGTAQSSALALAPAAFTVTPVTVDSTATGVRIEQAATQPDPTSALPIAYTVTFDEAVTGFTAADVLLGGTATGAQCTVSGSGQDYVVNVFAVSTDGTLSATIPGGAAFDEAGNANTPSVSVDNTVELDRVPPQVASALSLDATLTNADSVRYAVTFDDPVSGVDPLDFIARGNGVVGAVIQAVSGGGTDYIVAIDTGYGDGSLQLDISPTASIVDAAGNALSTQSLAGIEVYTIDRTPPTAQLALPPGQSVLTNRLPVAFAIHFDEPVTGVDASDVEFAAGPPGLMTAVTGAGTDYLVQVMTSADGMLQPRLVAGAAIDAAGNANEASSLAQGVTLERVPPRLVAIRRTSALLTNAASVTFSIEFDEAVSGLDATDFVADATGLSGVAVSSLNGSGSLYEATLTAGNGMGTLGLAPSAGFSAADAAGNEAIAALDVNEAYTVDRLAPIATITVGAGQAALTNQLPIEFEIHFSENVSELQPEDFEFSPNLAGVVSEIVGAGAEYVLRVTSGQDGVLLPRLRPGAVQDAAGNANEGTTASLGVEYDATPPRVLRVDPLDAMPPASRTVAYGVVFSEAIEGLTVDALGVLVTGSLIEAEIVGVTGSDASYIATLYAGDGAGTLALDLRSPSAIRDRAGNVLDAGGFAVEPYTFEIGVGRTFYVDQHYDGPETGTAEQPFRNIGAAVLQTTPNSGDRVLVRPGTYDKAVALPPGTSLVSTDGAAHTGLAQLVALGHMTTVRGFTLETDATAVLLDTGRAAEVTNCVFRANAIGLRVETGAHLTFLNNTVLNQRVAGLDVASGVASLVLRNNIFAFNVVAVRLETKAALEHAYNDAFGNGLNGIDVDLTDDPGFVEAEQGNVHLRADSPLRDAGDPAPEQSDIDGSRNDLGADGGPHGVQDVTAPRARIVTTPSPPRGHPPLTVEFDASLSDDEWGIADYAWDLDASDGIQPNLTGARVSTQFSTPGTRIVTLEVADNSGLRSQTTIEVRVGLPPSLEAMIVPQAGPPPLAVSALMSVDAPFGLAQAWWDVDADGLPDIFSENGSFFFGQGTLPGARDAHAHVVDTLGAVTMATVPLTLTHWPVLTWAQLEPGSGGVLSLAAARSLYSDVELRVPGAALTRPLVVALCDEPIDAPQGATVAAVVSMEPRGWVLSAPAVASLRVEALAEGATRRLWRVADESTKWTEWPYRAANGGIEFETTELATFVLLEYPPEPQEPEEDLRGAWLMAAGAFTLTAVAASGGEDGGHGPCFIATAAYGTPRAAQIEKLRRFRDTWLLGNAPGAAFVDIYYRTSPPIADAVARCPWLAALVRGLLVVSAWIPVMILAALIVALRRCIRSRR